MRFTPEPLKVICNTCGKWGETYDGAHPDLAVDCDCCPIAHDHMGLGCRTVTIQAKAYLTIFDINDLMEAAGMDIPLPAMVPDMEVI
jgi:hypothetical protein